MRKKNLSKIFESYCVNKAQRPSSQKGARSITNIFCEYLAETGDKSPKEFTVHDAKLYLSWYASRGVTNISQNNMLIKVGTAFNNMVNDGLIKVNPFANLKCLPPEPSTKRNLTDGEIEAIIQCLSSKNRSSQWTLTGLLLQYYCFVRPAELCRLKFRDFDLGRGALFMRKEASKKTGGWVTIPDCIVPKLRQQFEAHSEHPDHYVFGAYFKPGLKPLGVDTMGRTFKKAINILSENGYDFKGVTWYRVKHTGITDMANDDSISIFSTSKQARHQDIKTTMIYYTRPEINQSVKKYGKKFI